MARLLVPRLGLCPHLLYCVVLQDKGIIVFRGNTTLMHNRASYMGAGAYGGVAGTSLALLQPSLNSECENFHSSCLEVYKSFW